MRWWWQKAPDRSEAKEHLKRVMEREPEIKSLAEALREAERRNHFSEMVNAAITRGQVAKEGN